MRQLINRIFWLACGAAWGTIIAGEEDVALFFIVLMTASIIADIVLEWKEGE